jgi:hypothetical protein
VDPQRCGCVGVAFCVNRNLSLPGIFNVWMMTHLDLQIEPEAVCFFLRKLFGAPNMRVVMSQYGWSK